MRTKSQRSCSIVACLMTTLNILKQWSMSHVLSNCKVRIKTSILNLKTSKNHPILLNKIPDRVNKLSSKFSWKTTWMKRANQSMKFIEWNIEIYNHKNSLNTMKMNRSWISIKVVVNIHKHFISLAHYHWRSWHCSNIKLYYQSYHTNIYDLKMNLFTTLHKARISKLPIDCRDSTFVSICLHTVRSIAISSISSWAFVARLKVVLKNFIVDDQ